MDPLLLGISIRGFRSFGMSEPQRIGPMGKVHLVAGPNNSGKSNVLEVAFRALPALREKQTFDAHELDAPLAASADDRQLSVGLLLPFDDDVIREAISASEGARIETLRSFFQGPTFRGEVDRTIWIEQTSNDEGRPAWVTTGRQIDDVGSHLDSARRGGLVRQLAKRLTGQTSSNDLENAAYALGALVDGLKVHELVPPVARIGAFRRITADEQAQVIESDHDGTGLIGRLARLQNPGISEPENRERFVQVNNFVKSLFEDDEAEIDVPHDRRTLLVRYAGQWLPLENYGTGLHEVIVLAAAATVLSGHLVCIEEPEIHLHPSLQRSLLRYLSRETDNQYLIATHSAHLLDSERASISAVRLDAGNTRAETALKPEQVAAIGNELGARASDLVQANAVIWVEGPSDRIYIRGWIRAVEPDLVEGVHYSVLFYGGRLLAHLSANDPAVEEFVSLPRINRNFTIVMDSDRPKAGSKLNATKNRVRRELTALSEHQPWVTQGYVIENYVPPDLLATAIGEIHAGVTCTWKGSRYQDPLVKQRIRGRSSAVDKPAIAERVIDRWEQVEAWPLDLPSQVRRLVGLIERAND